jgi:hypothetical protein
MGFMKRFFRNGLAIAALCGVAPFASASVINLDFSSAGIGHASDSCGGPCYEITTNGLAYETGGLPGVNAWSFKGVMQFIDTGSGGIGAGIAGLNGGWRFNDLLGSDNLWGSFATVLGANDTGFVTYAIQGGTGLFQGALGSGSSLFSVTAGFFPYLFSYVENGSMRVAVGGDVAVFEPGVLALMVTGLALLAYTRRRKPLRLE